MTTAVPAESDALVAAYEDLRRAAVSGLTRGTSGLALLLRRGVRNWMETWTTWTPAATAPSAAAPTVSADVRAQVAAVLAGMALGREEAA